ncbi:unnamed protein product [Boreogadus saida]
MLGFKQLVQHPTHIGENTLDLFLTRDVDISDLVVSSYTSALSDHFLLTFQITECPVFDALRRPSSVATSSTASTSAASTSGSDPHPSTALSESLTAAVPPLCVPIFMRSSFIYTQRTRVLHCRRHYLSRTLTPTA